MLKYKMSNVCQDQDTFDKAFSNAVKNYNKEQTKKYKCSMIVFSIIYVIMIMWALTLALSVQTSSQEQKMLHILLACVAPPVYIASFYITRK